MKKKPPGVFSLIVTAFTRFRRPHRGPVRHGPGPSPRPPGPEGAAREEVSALMALPSTVYTASDFIRRVVDSLLHGECRGQFLCARCLVKLAKDNLDRSYTKPDIARVMDDIFAAPGSLTSRPRASARCARGRRSRVSERRRRADARASSCACTAGKMPRVSTSGTRARRVAGPRARPAVTPPRLQPWRPPAFPGPGPRWSRPRPRAVRSRPSERGRPAGPSESSTAACARRWALTVPPSGSPRSARG